MALNIKLDFDTSYPLVSSSEDLTASTFNTVLKNEQEIRIGVKINNVPHPYLPGVYNLAFGPIDNNGQIDDKAKLIHQDHSKVFSTVLLAGLTFLESYPERYLGVDGSNNARAFLYYRCVQNNFHYLEQFFLIYGVKYYVRILRKAKDKDDGHPVDGEDIVVIPEKIQKNKRIDCDLLFNYFMFKLK